MRLAVRSLVFISISGLVAIAPVQAQTFLDFNSTPGDFIGAGQQFTLTPMDGTITATGGDDGVEVRFSGATFWFLNFAAPTGTALVPGAYERAVRWPLQFTRPGLSVYGDGRACDSTGRFTVLEAGYGPGDVVLSFAADYEQHCDGQAPALFGSVRVNSSVPVQPRLSVSTASVFEGDVGMVSLPFVVSLSSPASGPVTVDYTTLAGTATAGNDYVAVTGTASFAVGETAFQVNVPVIGDILSEGNETLSLVLSNPVGASIVYGTGPGTILNDDPYKTFLFFDSTPGDNIGGGQQFTFTPTDGIFRTTPVDGGVDLAFDGDGGKFWTLHFVAPAGTTLSPGFYPGATRWPFQAPTAPGLDVGGEGRGCNTLTGEFTVLEAEFGPGGEVIRFAVDYEQHCEGDAPALFGSVRINSSVPLNGKDLGFYTVTPCRVLDTRATGPALAANATRSVSTAVLCGIPATAKALATNITSVGPTDVGNLRVYPAGALAPNASVLNFVTGQTRASNAIVGLGAGGVIAVRCDMPSGSMGATHLLVDVVGYFE